MCDSPVNLLMYGHTTSFVESEERKNKQFKDKLGELMKELAKKKQQNLKYLKEIDNQEETIKSLNHEIESEGRLKTLQLTSINSVNLSKEIAEKSCSLELNSSSAGKWFIKSTELPNKNVYLDKNNKSIESSFQQQLLQKKLKIEIKQPKNHINSYGNLYNRKSFSLNKFKFK